MRRFLRLRHDWDQADVHLALLWAGVAGLIISTDVWSVATGTREPALYLVNEREATFRNDNVGGIGQNGRFGARP